MSAYLGPIHYWLYNKIKWQEALTQEILCFAQGKGNTSLSFALNEKYASLPTESLEESINTSNIHGWLQEKVDLVERRFAFVVEALLADCFISLDELLEVTKNFGSSHSELTSATTAPEAYQYLNNQLLDGMPCDHVNSLTSSSEEQVIWTRTRQIHTSYWSEASNAKQLYDLLRNALVEGMITPTSLEFLVKEENVFEIRRRA